MHKGTMCVHFPSESSNPVTTFTLWEAISCVSSADEVSEQEQASNWISVLLLKVQLSMAELGGSGVWILVSWCKQGTLATYASHQHRIVQLCFSKELLEKAPWSLLTHMCEQMQACCDIKASCLKFQPLYIRLTTVESNYIDNILQRNILYSILICQLLHGVALQILPLYKIWCIIIE